MIWCWFSEKATKFLKNLPLVFNFIFKLRQIVECNKVWQIKFHSPNTKKIVWMSPSYRYHSLLHFQINHLFFGNFHIVFRFSFCWWFVNSFLNFKKKSSSLPGNSKTIFTLSFCSDWSASMFAPIKRKIREISLKCRGFIFASLVFFR